MLAIDNIKKRRAASRVHRRKESAYVGLKFASFLTRRVPPVGDTMGAMASPPLVQCAKVSLPWKKFFHIASVSSVLLIWPTLYFCLDTYAEKRNV
jgi:hypothetical protein